MTGKDNTFGKKWLSMFVIVGIALVVSIGPIGMALGDTEPFEETFEDLSEWHLVVYDSAGGSSNDPAPLLDTTMGSPAPSLDVNGDSWCGDGAYTQRTFDYTNGLVIEFDMYVASGYDWNWGHGGLSDHMPNLDNPRSDGAYVDPSRCDPSYIAGICFNDDGCYNRCSPTLGFAIRSEDGGESYRYSSNASEFQNEWHTYKINILPDGYVEFYMDETLVWESTKKIDKTFGPMPLVFGDRDAYGPVRIDNVQAYSATIPATIDIKPGSDPNCFNNDGHGVIPVAILSDCVEGYIAEGGLDATHVDPATVQLEGMAIRAVGKSDKLQAHIEDVNNDGCDDLVVQIVDQDGTFEGGETEATLTGNLYEVYGGTVIEGTDTICIVP